ncbi:MAG: hypothetical protein PF692_12575 [Kiritimatiellae bacterium]|jgi:hypothetical protein|nr:hypothetical protein [Kiritimatiellia bacterium]
MKYGINKYLGNWINKSGELFTIQKQTNGSITLSVTDKEGLEILRPFLDNKPMKDMPVDYDEYMDEFTVYLSSPEKGYALHFCMHPADCGPNPDEEIISPAVSCCEKYDFFNQYQGLFDALSNLKKIEDQN